MLAEALPLSLFLRADPPVPHHQYRWFEATDLKCKSKVNRSSAFSIGPDKVVALTMFVTQAIHRMIRHPSLQPPLPIALSC